MLLVVGLIDSTWRFLPHLLLVTFSLHSNSWALPDGGWLLLVPRSAAQLIHLWARSAASPRQRESMAPEPRVQCLLPCPTQHTQLVPWLGTLAGQAHPSFWQTLQSWSAFIWVLKQLTHLADASETSGANALPHSLARGGWLVSSMGLIYFILSSPYREGLCPWAASLLPVFPAQTPAQLEKW